MRYLRLSTLPLILSLIESLHCNHQWVSKMLQVVPSVILYGGRPENSITHLSRRAENATQGFNLARHRPKFYSDGAGSLI
ncbi:hypothetical protein IF1G_08405 [Cordyceps javanica]|uniref:Secreted protein n=1 Tax=Cordyceps javanica TaxID=43265 RepID=A0A545UUG4_9HYPO|nr:hypothetical protein IF1G_08405 [Cordyceps javanica]